MLARKGQAKFAACAITLFAWAIVSVVVWFSGGIGTHGVSYIAVAMIAGTALGARAGLAAGVVCITSTGLALLAEHQQWLPAPSVPVGSVSSFIAISFAIAVVTLLHLAAIRHIDTALEANKVALREREAARAENEARAVRALALAQFSQEALTAASPQSLFEHAAATIDATLEETTAFLVSRTADAEWQVSSRGNQTSPLRIELPDVAVPLTFTDDAHQSLALAKNGSLPRGTVLMVPIPSRHAERRWLGIVRHDGHSVEGDEEFLQALAGLFGSAFDRAHAEERALNAQKLEVIGRLSGGVAHDFNNVLTAILSASYELRELHPAADNELAILDDLDGAVRRASLLTRQLLAFGRREVTAPIPIDLRQLVSELAPMLRRLVGSHHALTVELPKEAVTVRGSLSQLEQVLLNLVVNARDSMPDGGPIQVTLTVTDELVTLAVSDAGCGMDEHTQRYAFQPFFTTKRDGTGLGLATVADVADKLKGAVELESRAQQGTTVRFSLPIATVSTVRRAWPEPTSFASRCMPLGRRSTRSSMPYAR